MKILIAAVGKNEHLGDNVMKTGILEAARFNFPAACITVCAKFPEVFRNNPGADEIIDGSKFKTLPGARRFLRERRFDLVIDAGAHPGQIFLAAARELSDLRIRAVDASPQIFRNELRKMFNVPSPPLTDGDIPLVIPKTDEFLLSMKIQGLKVLCRFFPLIVPFLGSSEQVVRRLRIKGFDLSRPVYILCESASGPEREWGTVNFVKLAKMLQSRGAQIIVSVTGKDEKEALAPYLAAGAGKDRLFFLKTSLGEYFALLGLNNYFFRNVIAGVVAGDTGALHAVQAVNNRLPEFLRPAVICLGHNQASGDIRYADPGTVYLARLKSKWDKRLETAAAGKMKFLRRKKLAALIGLPCRFISIDEPADRRYLARRIPDESGVVPVFSGRQIYGHTILRNVLKNGPAPLSDAERRRFYRRMDVKKVEPSIVIRLLEESEAQKAEDIVKNGTAFGFLRTARGREAARKMETQYIALSSLDKIKTGVFPRPIYFSAQNGKAVLLNSRLPGKKLLDCWKIMSPKQRTLTLKRVLENLKLAHRCKFRRFGKFGISSSLLFDSWEDYMNFCLKARLKEIGREQSLGGGEISRLKNFIGKNSDCLRSSSASLVHHDVKIDNVLVDKGKASGIVDLEYATAAPIDYEADTLLRSFDDPEIYFGPRGRFLKRDAGLVKEAIRRYYPELLNRRGIVMRLKIYGIKFYLDLLAMGKKPAHCRMKLRELTDVR